MEITDEEFLVTFIDACPPPLPDGDYQIKAAQEVTWQGNAQPVQFHSEYNFSIYGPRFTLDPAEVQSVFPPPKQRGHFERYMPHIVFARRSLPWERTLDGSLQAAPYAPWLWLMSLTEEEAATAAVSTVTLADVFTSPDPTIKSPDIRPETGDDPASKCLVVDVPVALFETLVPSLDDLPYMASARKVSVADKELTAKTEDEYFSMSLANRFTKVGTNNTQYLVSLEGYRPILSPAKVGGAFTKVRLVVLTMWTFSNLDDTQTFDELMAALTVDRLSLPNPSNDADVASALQMGYTALDHTTRQGEHTVSWYRGPLLPMDVPKDTPDSYANSDAALRYDPHFGMFDISYAAAMQIGRLLGLQSHDFTASLTRFRAGNQARMLTLLQRHRLFSSLETHLALPRDAMSLLAKDVFLDALAAYWGDTLGKIVLSRDLSKPSLLGNAADPSGLREQVGTRPGLLGPEEMDSVVERTAGRSNADASEAIRQILLEERRS
jgi:hypothetical protein